MTRGEKDFLSIVPGAALGVEVVGGDIRHALRLFKRKVKSSGRLIEYREHQAYIKPSVKRRRQRMDAIYRNQKYGVS